MASLPAADLFASPPPDFVAALPRQLRVLAAGCRRGRANIKAIELVRLAPTTCCSAAVEDGDIRSRIHLDELLMCQMASLIMVTEQVQKSWCKSSCWVL